MESTTAMTMINTLGGAATPISWGELYTSLQQGVVDGAENNPPSFYLSRHYEVCKYYALDEHTVLPDVLIIGTHLWNALNTQEKQWLQQAVDASVTYQRELWAISEKEALEAVKNAGVTVLYPDKSVFAQQVSTIYTNLESDTQLHDLVQRIENIQ
jgi:TRAP-type C4-dicarboxylate transport system substrate-binding protein